jgi:DNA repair exonuclease SbcCD ATPase subunit
LLPAGFALQIREDADLSTVEKLGRVCGALAEALSTLNARRAAVDELERAVPVSVRRAEADVVSARTRLTQASTEGPARARLARAALDTLEGDVCPVCGQTINHDELIAHLEESLSHATAIFSAAQEASDALAQASSRLSEAREQEHRLAELRAEMRAAEDQAHAAVAAVGGLTLEGALPADQADLEIAAHGFERFVSALREVWRRASQAGGAHLERLAGERDALAAEVSAAAGALKELEARYARSKSLERDAHEAAEAIVAEALARLQPSFAEVFDRLNPNPAFTELRARQDVLRNVNQVVPIVHDPLRGLDANPLLVFSEGQLNVVALSYFLGMALNARDAMLPFLILDDPLQALDTLAVLGFGDLCRRIRDERQLIITTHDRRFADILGRKLAPREPGATTLVHEFEGWTREGPSVKTTQLEPAEVVPLLRRVS